MKVVLRSSSPLLSLLGVDATPPRPAATVLRQGSAGQVHIGMSALDVFAEFHERAQFNELNSRADIYPGSRKQRRAELSCELTDGVVTAIDVFSGAYKTEAGIGPGDSLVALANTYQLRWVADNIAQVDGLNMTFKLEKD